MLTCFCFGYFSCTYGNFPVVSCALPAPHSALFPQERGLWPLSVFGLSHADPLSRVSGAWSQPYPTPTFQAPESCFHSTRAWSRGSVSTAHTSSWEVIKLWGLLGQNWQLGLCPVNLHCLIDLLVLGLLPSSSRAVWLLPIDSSGNTILRVATKSCSLLFALLTLPVC